MNNIFKNLVMRAAIVLLLCCVLSVALSGCNDQGKTPDISGDIDKVALEYDGEALSDFIALVDFYKLNQVEEIFEEYYIGEYKPYSEVGVEVLELLIENVDFGEIETVDDATTIFIGAYLDVLGDKYAYYYDANAFSDYTADSEGEYVGIGVMVTLTEDNYVEALTVYKDGPAEKAGILPGDIFIAVDGEDVAEVGYYETIERVKGEKGTTVNITLLRNGEEMSFDVVRDQVTEITVELEMKPDNIAYIHISSFDDKTYDQFIEAYYNAIEAGAKGFVFDVRNNPGGRLDTVVAILEFILPDGPIVHLKYKDARANYTISSVIDCNPFFILSHKYVKNNQVDMPMVVLTNGNTASAGELFTSSLNDYDAATIMGAKTYGKGVGQTSIALKDANGKEDGSAVTITYFYYAPPYSDNYDGIGIPPDVEVELSEEAQKKNLYKLTEEEDIQLAKALEELKIKIATQKTLGKN